MTDHFSGQERRAKPPPITRSEVEEIIAAHEIKEREALRAEMDHVLRAFPDGVEAHRNAHEAMIEAAQAQREFWIGLRKDIVGKSIWGILQILALLTAAGLAAKFGLAIPLSK